MNGIIALCHFCEEHGPRVMFCTQAVHSTEPHQYGSKIQNGAIDSLSSLEDDIPSSAAEAAANSSFQQNLKKPKKLCVACRSMDEDQSGYISHDREADVQYISTQHPRHPEILTMVGEACTRSLSCEVCPGKEGAIFIGDSTRGHVISYTFFLQNYRARGLKQWYSAMIFMMDKVYLLNMWPFLVEQLKEAISRLKQQADAVYAIEQAGGSASIGLSCLKGQRDSPPARSLKEITGTNIVFEQIHQRFTWILKAGSNRLTERLLEGPPTEDSIIDLEKTEELTEEGFVKLYTKNDNPEMEFDDVPIQAVAGKASENATPSATPEDMSPGARREFLSLRHLLHVLGMKKFCVLAHHVLIGNQVIIRSGHRRLVASVVNNFRKFLPLGCCRAVYFSDHYEDSYKCNILGIAQGVPIPQTATHYVVMDIIEPETAIEALEDAGGRSGTTSRTSSQGQPLSSVFSGLPIIEMDAFGGYIFILTTPVLLPDQAPAVLGRMLVALSDFSLADTVVEQCLICVKEEWMNKVKLLFKFTKAGGRRTEEDTKQLLMVIGAQAQDKPLLEFWKSGLSLQYRNHMLSSSSAS